MLSNAYFLAKFRFDTAENEPAKNLQNLNFAKFANFANPDKARDAAPARPVPAAAAAAAGRLPPDDQERFQIELANFAKFC